MKFSKNLSLILTLLLAVGAALFAPEVVGADPQTLIIAAPGMAVLTSPVRAQYNRLLKMLQREYDVNIGNQTPIISRSDLRIENELTATQNQLEFKVRESEGNGDRETESKLSSNELFYLTGIALNIAKCDESGSFTNGNANKPLHTFPDRKIFTGNSGAEANALETLYHGSLTLMTGSLARIEELLTHELRYAPQTQTEEVDTGTPPEVGVAQYGPTPAHRGVYPITPEIGLDGRRDNKFTLTLGPGNRTDIAGPDTANKNYAVLILHGFKVSSLNLDRVGRKSPRM